MNFDVAVVVLPEPRDQLAKPQRLEDAPEPRGVARGKPDHHALSRQQEALHLGHVVAVDKRFAREVVELQGAALRR